MPRNLYRRVEAMFPVEAPALKERILSEIIPSFLRDNQRARLLAADGAYERLTPRPDQRPCRCQEELLTLQRQLATSGNRPV